MLSILAVTTAQTQAGWISQQEKTNAESRSKSKADNTSQTKLGNLPEKSTSPTLWPYLWVQNNLYKAL